MTTIDLPVTLIGDFNIDMPFTSSDKLDLLDIVQIFGCNTVFQSPIRVTENSKTLVDLCFTTHNLDSFITC